ITKASTGSPATQPPTFADNGTYTVTVKVTDKDGGYDSKTFQVTVANVPPTVTPPANQSSNEGASASFTLGSFSDPGANDGPWSDDVDWGDTTAPTPFAHNTRGPLSSPRHTYTAALPSSYTVTVKVTDKDGGYDSKTFQVTVANVPPTVTAPANQSSNEGANASFTLGSFTDPGANDGPWSVDVNWGDGTAHTTRSQERRGGNGCQS